DEFKTGLDGIDKFVPKGENSKKYSELVPEGPGWVIEVRGHTYHNKHREFLIDTFVYNLNKFGFGKGLAPFSATPATAPADGNFPDALDGRISHAFLYFAREVKEPQP